MTAVRRVEALVRCVPIPAEGGPSLGRARTRWGDVLAEFVQAALPPREVNVENRARFVCPFCGRSFFDSRRRCDRCDGRPVVGADERAVYDHVVSLCGPRYDPT